MLEIRAQSDEVWSPRFASRATIMTSSAIRELLKISEQPDFISFAGGFPAPELFPAAEVAQVSQSILRDDGGAALQYGPTEGYAPLRQLWADRLGVSREHVLITTGSQQALDLLGKVLIDPGDEVLVESPTYLAALQAWSVYGALFASLACDADGLQTARLPPARRSAKFLYVVPTFQNPSGTTLTLERRLQLVEWARRTEIPVVEDDPYGQLRFEGEPLPRLVDLDQAQGHVIHLTTYSKTLAPSLRVGVLVAPPPLVRKLVQAKQATDLHTSTLNQRIAYELDRCGFLDQQREQLCASYRERRDVMLRALEQHFPPGVSFTRPQGGMFLWVTLPLGMEAVPLLDEALKQRVAFVPGQFFFA